MPRAATVYRILVASPGDVAEERAAIRDVLQDWNVLHAARGLYLEPVLWETHAHPAMGERAQAVINEQLAQECDVLIGIFWSRLGTPTGVAQSGTVEEVQQFQASGRPVLLYFSEAPVPPERLDADQLARVQEFRAQYPGLYWTYRTVAELRTQLFRHLTLHFDDVVPPHAAAPAAPERERAHELGLSRRDLLGVRPVTDPEGVPAVRRRYVAASTRFDAKWSTERDSDVPSFEEGRRILGRAQEELTEVLVDAETHGLDDIADELRPIIRMLANARQHELYLDGGVSQAAFWENGNQVAAQLQRVLQLF